jgi:hypothetical protein
MVEVRNFGSFSKAGAGRISCTNLLISLSFVNIKMSSIAPNYSVQLPAHAPGKEGDVPLGSDCSSAAAVQVV